MTYIDSQKLTDVAGHSVSAVNTMVIALKVMISTIIFGVVGLLLLSIILIFLGVEPILIAKIILSIVMFFAGFMAIIVVLIAKSWQESLAAMEAELDECRDIVMLHATVYRAQLAMLQDRFKKEPEPIDSRQIAMLLQQVGPLVGLLLSRNTSILKWGMATFKLGQSLYRHFSQKKNN